MRQCFGKLSERPDINVYLYRPAEDGTPLSGNTKAVEGPEIEGKICLKAIRAIRAAIRKYDIDAVFSHSTSGLSNALLASIGTKARCVGYRGTQHKLHRADPTNYLALLNPRVAHIICLTPDIAEHLANFVPTNKLSVKGKPFAVAWVDDALKNPRPLADGLPPFSICFVGISKDRPYKGLGVLLKAMETLADEGVGLTVIGDASKEDKAAAPRNVVFVPTRPDAISFIPAHKLLVLPSTRDAFPRVVREAQSCRVPCIVSNIVGARDLIIDGKTGILVGPGNPDAIVDAVRALKNDPARLAAMSEAARQHIIRNFATEPYVDFLYKVFTEHL